MMASSERQRASERAGWSPEDKNAYAKFVAWWKEHGLQPTATAQDILTEWDKLGEKPSIHAMLLVINQGRADRKEIEKIVREMQQVEVKLEASEAEVAKLNSECARLREAKDESDRLSVATVMDGAKHSGLRHDEDLKRHTEEELKARQGELQSLQGELQMAQSTISQLSERLNQYERTYATQIEKLHVANEEISRLQDLVEELQNKETPVVEPTTLKGEAGSGGSSSEPKPAKRRSAEDNEKDLASFIVPERDETFSLRCQFQTDQLKMRRERYEKTNRKPIIEYELKPPGKLSDCTEYKDIPMPKFTRAGSKTYTWMQHVEALESWMDPELEEKPFVKIWMLKRWVEPEVAKFMADLGNPANFNYEVLVDAVRSEYSTTRLPTDAMTDWMEMKQLENESVSEFARRFKDLNAQLPTTLPGFFSFKDAALKTNFLYRVHSQLAYRVKKLNATLEYDAGVSLDHLIRYLQHAEKELAAEKERKAAGEAAKAAAKQQSDDKKPQGKGNQAPKTGKWCSYCENGNHNEDACKRKLSDLESGQVKKGSGNQDKAPAPVTEQKQSNFGRGGAPGQKPIFKKRNLSEVQCFNCNQYGHFSNVCPAPAKPRNQFVAAKILQSTVEQQASLVDRLLTSQGVDTSLVGQQQAQRQPTGSQTPNQQWYDDQQRQYQPMPAQNWVQPGRNPTAVSYEPQGGQDFMNAKAFARVLVKDCTITRNWYDMLEPTSSMGFVRHANVGNAGSEVLTPIPTVGHDPNELKLEVLNGRAAGPTAVWDNSVDAKLKGCEECTQETIINGLRKVTLEAVSRDKRHADRLAKLKRMAGEAIDSFVCTGALRIGNHLVLDVLHDSGAQLNAMSLRAYWSLVGRDAVIRYCSNSLDFTPWDKKECLTPAGGGNVRIFFNALVPVTAGDEEVELVFAIYEDAYNVIMMGTPGMRRLGFTLTAPHLDKVDLLDPASTAEGWRKVRDNELAAIKAAGCGRSLVPQAELIEPDLQARINKAKFNENASTGEMLRYLAGQPQWDRGFFDEDMVDKRSEWKNHMRVGRRSASEEKEPSPPVINIDSGSSIDGLSPIPGALDPPTTSTAGHTPYPVSTVRKAKPQDVTPVVMPTREKVRVDTPMVKPLVQTKLNLQRKVTQDDDSECDPSPLAKLKQAREAMRDAPEGRNEAAPLSDSRESHEGLLKKLMDSVAANAKAIAELRDMMERRRTVSQSTQSSQMSEAKSTHSQSRIPKATTRKKSTGSVSSTKSARAATARKPELTEMPQLTAEGATMGAPTTAATEMAPPKEVNPPKGRNSRKTSRTDGTFSVTGGVEDGSPARKMSKPDETFVVTTRSRANSGSVKKRSNSVVLAEVNKMRPPTTQVSRPPTKSEGEGSRKSSAFNSIASVFRRVGSSRQLDTQVNDCATQQQLPHPEQGQVGNVPAEQTGIPTPECSSSQ